MDFVIDRDFDAELLVVELKLAGFDFDLVHLEIQHFIILARELSLLHGSLFVLLSQYFSVHAINLFHFCYSHFPVLLFNPSSDFLLADGLIF